MIDHLNEIFEEYEKQKTGGLILKKEIVKKYEKLFYDFIGVFFEKIPEIKKITWSQYPIKNGNKYITDVYFLNFDDNKFYAEYNGEDYENGLWGAIDCEVDQYMEITNEQKQILKEFDKIMENREMLFEMFGESKCVALTRDYKKMVFVDFY